MNAQMAQLNFDKLVSEYSKDAAIDDAILEAIESLKEANIPSDGIFLYSNQIELGEKQKMDSRCVTIENASKLNESFVNANFAMQGIKQILCGSPEDSVTIGSWKLIQNRRLFQNVLKLIPAPSGDDTEDQKDMNIGLTHFNIILEWFCKNISYDLLIIIDEDDDDEDDEEEDKILTTVQPLEFLIMLIRQGVNVPNRIFNFEQV